MKDQNLYGLILTGGKSTRMRRDKALLDYHGIPQREYLFALLEKFCSRVFTSCRKDQEVPENLNPLFDQYYLEGPANGILSAFHFNPEKSWLVIAVDMPYVNEKTLETLLLNRDSTKIATCFFNREEKLPEPLLTIWEPTAYPLLLKWMVDGNYSPRHFLTTHSIHTINPTDTKTLLNTNYPEQVPSTLE